MKKTVLALTAAAALTTAMAAALPAAAQVYGGSLREVNYREARISQQIEWGARRGTLTRYEARDLRVKLNEVERLERYYARTGGYVSRQEIYVLNRKLDGVEYLLRANNRDGETRWDDSRYGDGRWHDRDRDGYPDRW
jgi:hypothetical protein